KFIGQFTDDSSLSYLNARYMDSSRGQFLSQDPVFWGTQQKLTNPQSLNSYSYANGNPVTNKDPEGLDALGFNIAIGGEAGFGIYGGVTYSAGLTYVYNPGTGERWLVPVFSSGG